MTDPGVSVVRTFFGRLPLSMSLSVLAHGFAACAVGVIVSARPAPPRAPLEPLLLTVSAMQRPPEPVPVDIERPRVPATAPSPAAPPPPTAPRPVAARVAAAPAAAPAPAPVLASPTAPEAPTVPEAAPAPAAMVPAAPPSAVAATASPEAAGPQGSAHAPPGPMVDVGEYLSGVRERVGRFRRYPPMAIEMGLEGVVEVRVLLNPDGTLAAPPALDESCGHEMLDAEALRIVARAAPFPPLTGHHDPVRLRVPVHFHLD